MITYIIQTNRKSLIPHLYEYFKNFSTIQVEVIKLSKSSDILKYKDKIMNGEVNRFVFSNGTDKIDVEIYKKIIKINPACLPGVGKKYQIH